MIVIPNLFGAYQKGREEAIKANWDDLSNYEDIESKRTRNDLDALTLLGRQADFGYDRENARFIYNTNQRNDEVGQVSHAGNLYNADTNSILAKTGNMVVGDAASNGELYNWANNALYAWGYGTGHAKNVAQSNSINSGVNLGVLQKNIDALVKTRNELFVSGLDTSRLDAEIAYNRSLMAQTYSSEQTKHLDSVRRAAMFDTKAQAGASETAHVTGQNALYTANKNYEDAPKNRASALNARITAAVNNMEIASQRGHPEAFAQAVREYENLTGEKYNGRPFGAVATSVTPASGQALFGGGQVGQYTVLATPQNGTGVGTNTVLAQTTGPHPTVTTPVVSVKNAQKPQTPVVPPTGNGNIFSNDPSGRGVGHPSYAGQTVDGKSLFHIRSPYMSSSGGVSLVNTPALVGWGTPGYQYPRW